MTIRPILLPGNPRLYKESEHVSGEEMDSIRSVAVDLRDTMMDFRRKYGVGRARPSDRGDETAYLLVHR